MPRLVLAGPFPLTPAGIGINQMPRMCAAYCLGSMSIDGKFITGHVGRAENDLAAQLRQHVGSSNYDAFLYALAPSLNEAFAIECQLYHDFAPRDNTTHPLRPPNTTWKCPVCGQ